ncbi:hypothetical protein GGR54DRAFT_376752 [Hypoxylon sp. NC1633]|nr:hypothetical protein GGR54DRAFT_376752 [Hypoxylon sp. NC1633]
MTSYHISVRDYHWSHQNIVVQSPIPNLTCSVPALIIRPLEGANEQEPRIIDSAVDLRDDIEGGAYQAEAHGVFVSTDPQRPDTFPVWVPILSIRYREKRVQVVNLKTFEALNASMARICWVPHRMGPDDNLYTIIGAPRITVGKVRVLVLIQQVGHPKEAKLDLADPSALAGYSKIDENQKKKLFDIQLRFIRTNSKPPSKILLGGLRVFSSPDRYDQGRRTLEDVIDGRSSSRPYTCDCNFHGLYPTAYNPRPSHRHGTDEECSRGSTHQKHCVFADHTPTVCVIGDSHEHCVDRMQEMLGEIEGLPGGLSDAEAIFKEAGF